MCVYVCVCVCVCVCNSPWSGRSHAELMIVNYYPHQKSSEVFQGSFDEGNSWQSQVPACDPPDHGEWHNTHTHTHTHTLFNLSKLEWDALPNFFWHEQVFAEENFCILIKFHIIHHVSRYHYGWLISHVWPLRYTIISIWNG